MPGHFYRVLRSYFSRLVEQQQLSGGIGRHRYRIGNGQQRRNGHDYLYIGTGMPGHKECDRIGIAGVHCGCECFLHYSPIILYR